MKKGIVFTLISAVMMTACTEQNKQSDEPVIGKAEIVVADGIMTPEALHLFGQVSGGAISPDGKQVVYGVSYGDIELNKRNRELFVVNHDGTERQQITHSAKGESGEKWIKDGKKIAFIYEGQLWEMNPDGSKRTKLSDYEPGIEGFKFSPDESKVLFISQVKTYKPSSERYPDLNKTSGIIYDELMYKHWDEWVTTAPHPFIADFDGKALSNIVDIMEGEPYEAPLKPFADIADLDWHPNGKQVVYVSKKMTGKAYTESTNSDIYLYDLETKKTENLTEGMMGYDTHPRFNATGSHLAWLSMERDGYEADRIRLFVMDMDSRIKEEWTKEWDNNVDDFCWGVGNNVTLFFVSNVQGTSQLFSFYWADDIMHTEQLTKGDWDYAGISYFPTTRIDAEKNEYREGYLLSTRRSLSCPPEVYAVTEKDNEQINLSEENTEMLKQIRMGKVEERWIKTTLDEDMLTWIVYPPNFDPNKKYPAILYCQGGPQSTVSQFWSVRWNLQMMAANGYIVVAPNRHGVPGFGQAWNEQISGDYGGQNMKDYFSAIDEMAKEPFIDETRLGCTGASYGGFSVFWLAGNHDKRFKAFFAHAGIFNLEAQYLETEEMFFANWDMGGPYWDKSNAVAQRTFANSPHRFVDKWDTPIMVSHGELDYRILASQGMMAYNAAQLRDIPSRLLIFPNENHWIFQPQNGVLFQREFFRWFDQWLK